MATIATRGDRTGGSRLNTAAPAIERRALEYSPVTLRVGFWAAVVATVGAIAFAVGIVLNIAVVPGPAWTGDIQAYAHGYSSLAMAVTVAPSLLIVPAYVALVGSLSDSGLVSDRVPLAIS